MPTKVRWMKEGEDNHEFTCLLLCPIKRWRRRKLNRFAPQILSIQKYSAGDREWHSLPTVFGQEAKPSHLSCPHSPPTPLSCKT